MKREVFNKYVEEVCQAFEIERKQLFTKDKSTAPKDARFMLYLLCKKRPMKPKYIKEYMWDNGYEVDHPPILYGIKTAEKRMRRDVDFRNAYKKIKACIA